MLIKIKKKNRSTNKYLQYHLQKCFQSVIKNKKFLFIFKFSHNFTDLYNRPPFKKKKKQNKCTNELITAHYDEWPLFSMLIKINKKRKNKILKQINTLSNRLEKCITEPKYTFESLCFYDKTVKSSRNSKWNCLYRYTYLFFFFFLQRIRSPRNVLRSLRVTPYGFAVAFLKLDIVISAEIGRTYEDIGNAVFSSVYCYCYCTTFLRGTRSNPDGFFGPYSVA